MNTRLRGLWKKVKAVRVTLLLLFVSLLLTGCNLKLNGLYLERADSLSTVTSGVQDARKQYLDMARKCLSNRGVVIAMPPAENDEARIDFDNISDGETLATIKTLARCVLMTSGENRGKVEGSMTAEISGAPAAKSYLNGQHTIPYELVYGYATLKSGDGTYTPGSTDGSDVVGWILHIDFSALATDAIEWDDGTSTDLSSALDLTGGEWQLGTSYNNKSRWVWRSDGNGYSDGYFDDDEIFIIVWSTQSYVWTLHEKDYPKADPLADVYGAFGTGTVEPFTEAYDNHKGYSVIKALFGVSSASTVVAPSNNILTKNGTSELYEVGGWYTFLNDDSYIRVGPGQKSGTTINDINLYSWDGSGKANQLYPGYEALTSSVIDYGHIWVLSPTASATEIRDIQQKLNKVFGGSDSNFSTVLTNSESELDGGAVLNTAFHETSLCVMPPGFGILCYSVIPRNGLCSLTQADTTRDSMVGVVRPVMASGETTPSLGLGFVGPNPQMINAMETVLKSSGGGFAVINQHIYLMTYPVSSIGYLYTNEGSDNPCRAYIGLGSAPIYYNLVYDRLDYRYGDNYQFETTATAATEDPLYADYNFVGGIAVKDTTGTVCGTGGVYILQDDKGNNSTCRVQIADKDDVQEAVNIFKELNSTYWINNVPLWDADGDGNNGIQDFVFYDGTTASEELRNCLILKADGRTYFKGGYTYGDSAFNTYINKWQQTLDTSSLEVPQFVLMDYVETTLLPGATVTNSAVLTGRKIRLLPDAIKYDSTNHLYYYDGRTGLKIGEYVTTDGSRKLDDLFLGDIVDIRALCGVGYTKQADGTTWTEVQPPYGYNSMFPIGISLSDYNTSYASLIAQNENSAVKTAINSWIDSNLDISDDHPIIENFGTMNYWDGVSGTLADSSYYQSVAAVNAVSSLTSVATDENGNSTPADAVVAVLNINGADTKTHLGETNITQNTRIDELPYVCTNIITFSEPFPNTIFSPNDTEKVYGATEANMKTPNVMYTVAVGTGIQHGNFYHAWVTSEAPTDSITWWNNYLDAHGFDYCLNVQIVKQYLETNYSYLANEDNRLRFDIVGAQYWSEELDALNPKRGGNRTVNMVKTLSNVFGWICIIYALICLLFWAVDIYAGLDKDFYKMLTGGRYVASAEAMPPTQSVHYATFLNALARSVIICIAGVVLIYIGAPVILAKMFKFLALVLRLIAGYWKQ